MSESEPDSSIPLEDSRKRCWMEIGVAISVGWLVPMMGALVSFINGYGEVAAWENPSPASEPMLELVYRGAASISAFVPVLFIMWLHRRWADFGVVRLRVARDIGIALLIVVTAFIAYYALAWPLAIVGSFAGVDPYLLDAGASAYAEYGSIDETAAGPVLQNSAIVATWVVTMAALIINSFAEEFVFRGLLLERLTRVIGPHSAVWVSASLFASYHMYMGIYGVFSAFGMGVIAAYSMRWSRSIWPCVIGHTLMNFLITIVSG